VSRIFAFYTSVLGASVIAAAVPGAARQDPDALYRGRETLASARQAADIWAARTASGRDFESAWKLARACYWLGTHAPDQERRAALERGVAAGEQAIKLSEARPEGHFWMAANMGALAESFGLRQGLKYRGRIRDALERVLAIDRAWQDGSADRALGWWYFKVPGLFGGSTRRAKEHLHQSLKYNPQSTASMFFLAEIAIDEGRRDEARTWLERVIAAPVDAEWAPEDRDFQQKARTRLQEIMRRRAAS
jgi:hypothetical protein